jgi:drug/metabolite transporter (DMT)-like permease
VTRRKNPVSPGAAYPREVTAHPRPRARGLVIGLAAAVSFGISAPLAKELLEEVEPQLLAGLLYLGAFALLTAVPRRAHTRETPVRRADAPRVALMVVAGGIVAPVLLLVGLVEVSAISGSLLLNLEGPLTVLIAALVFGEYLGLRASVASALIFGGATVLALANGDLSGTAWGVALIAAACAAWALDNNLTQSLTLRDPRAVVRIKVGVAGAFNLVVALLRGEHLPTLALLLAALTLGAISYGASVLLDAYALRALGAAREAAVFATAPLAGVFVAVTFFGDTFSTRQLAAAALMAAGVILLLRDRHLHVHTHQPTQHEHVHVHDLHHQHEHIGGVDLSGPHAHAHSHRALVHAHEHVSDLHHRHRHGDRD